MVASAPTIVLCWRGGVRRGSGGGGGGDACVRARVSASASVFMLSSELQRTDVISDELKRRRCRPPRQRPCSHQCPTRPEPGRPSAGSAQCVPGSANARIARQKETRHGWRLSLHVRCSGARWSERGSSCYKRTNGGLKRQMRGIDSHHENKGLLRAAVKDREETRRDITRASLT
jgi:hypothetical protein